MPLLDLVDDTFVVAPVPVLAAVVADSRRWAGWWPDLELTTTRDRGLKGRQWRVAGTHTGTAEIWLEPWADGVILHLYLRLDPLRAPAGDGLRRRRWVDSRRQVRAQEWKRVVHTLKDELEHGRAPGTGAGAVFKADGLPAEADQDGQRRGDLA